MYSLKSGFVYRSVAQGEWEINYGRPHGKEEFIGLTNIDGVQCAVFSDGLQELAQSVRFAADAQGTATSAFRLAA